MMKISRKPGLRSTLKASVVIVMLLLLLIPLSMIRSQVYEREMRADEAAQGVIEGAGGALDFTGPLLVMPYELEVSELVDGKVRRYMRRGDISLLPENVVIDGELDVVYRQRGIYRVPVYTADVETSGFFIMPKSGVFPDGAEILWDEFRLVFGIGDMRGIREVSSLQWGSRRIALGPDAGHPLLGPGIGAPIMDFPDAGSKMEFSWSMEIGGGGSVSVTPLGRNSELTLSGNWPSPSFQGALLPEERQLNNEGFSAHWRIPEVSRPIQPWWDSNDGLDMNLSIYALRVDLLESVGVYTMTERSVKYGIIFLLIPFVVFFVFETLGGLKIHPVQYLLAGAADICFYLLLLALSEHLGFNAAYIIAAAAVTVLISFYTGRITSISMPIVLAAAYFWLWIALQSEDYALLIGSVGLFLIVAFVMILTRKVDWYGVEDPEPDDGDGE